MINFPHRDQKSGFATLHVRKVLPWFLSSSLLKDEYSVVVLMVAATQPPKRWGKEGNTPNLARRGLWLGTCADGYPP